MLHEQLNDRMMANHRPMEARICFLVDYKKTFKNGNRLYTSTSRLLTTLQLVMITVCNQRLEPKREPFGKEFDKQL